MHPWPKRKKAARRRLLVGYLVGLGLGGVGFGQGAFGPLDPGLPSVRGFFAMSDHLLCVTRQRPVSVSQHTSTIRPSRFCQLQRSNAAAGWNRPLTNNTAATRAMMAAIIVVVAMMQFRMSSPSENSGELFAADQGRLQRAYTAFANLTCGPSYPSAKVQ
jgi:hypothetical protein